MKKPTALDRSDFPVARETGIEIPNIEPGSKHYRAGKLSIIISPPFAGAGWHMSISRRDRYPSWDEIVYYRYKLLPGDITMVMMLPPLGQYINVDENCFQLHEERENHG